MESIAAYIVWLGLTCFGRRPREEMSEEDQVRYDACVFGLEVTEVDHTEARRLYLEATNALPDGNRSPGVGDAMKTFYITPTLCVGDMPPFPHTECSTAEEAFTVIHEEEGTALVPTLCMAMDTLRLLGLEDRVIDDRIYFSLTGRILYAV